MSATASKKRGGAKERQGPDSHISATNLQNPFLSAAHTTVWPYEAAAVSRKDGPSMFTASANAIRGRPNGAFDCDDAWLRAESPSRTYTVDRLLPDTDAWREERRLYSRLQTVALSPLARDRVSIDSASVVPFDPLRVRDALFEAWLTHVASHHPSPLQYPHHEIHFKIAPIPVEFPSFSAALQPAAFMQVAAVLHRLLEANLRRCNAQQRTPDQGAEERVPPTVFARLLGSSVYNNNFAGPPVEMKDTAFDWVASREASQEQEGKDQIDTPGAAVATSPSPPPQSHLKVPANEGAPPPSRRFDAITVVSCADSVHINVCIGSHYYKLCIIHPHEGRLRSIASLAADLEALYTHHTSLLVVDPLPGASPSVRQDRQEMERMFAELSRLSDDVAFDVRRRLRAASEVNAYSLDTLEAGLLTLVLRDDPNQAGVVDTGRPNAAHWLHSVCCLETSLVHPEQWIMRLHAIVVPLQAGMEWISSALPDFAAPAGDICSPAEETIADVSEPAAGALLGAPVSSATSHRPPIPQHECSSFVNASGHAEYLEFWLPEKHCVPLRPYASPVWNRAETQVALSCFAAHPCALIQFVMSLLRTAAAWKRSRCSVSKQATNVSSHENQWPRVVLAVQPPRGGSPSLLELDLPSVQHFYEVLAAPPLLFAADTRRRVEEVARREIAALLNICWYTAATVRLPAQKPSSGSWWDGCVGDGGCSAIDICVSFAVVSRGNASSSSSAVATNLISRCITDVTLPSLLSVNCTVQQTIAERQVHASRCAMMDAVVSANIPATTSMVAEFSAALEDVCSEQR